MNAEVTTIGPECFTDGTVICYKGENYTRQPQQVTITEERLALLEVELDWFRTSDVPSAAFARVAATLLAGGAE